MNAATTLVFATDQVSDGALIVALGVALLAGVLSFLSPCVLPLVPAYLAFVTGLSAADLDTQHRAATSRGVSQEVSVGTRAASTGSAGAQPVEPGEGSSGRQLRVRRRVVVSSLGFVLGTAVVFVSFGALFGSIGHALRTHAVGLAQIFGVVTILLGLLMAGAFDRIAPLQRDVRIHRVPGHGLAAAPVLGFTFALGWTPCIGPTLGTVLGLSASTDGATAARGALLSVAYCVGLGLPLLVTGLAFTRAMAVFAVIKRHYRVLMVAGGLGLVVLGVLQVTGVWTTFTNALQSRFGGWNLPL